MIPEMLIDNQIKNGSVLGFRISDSAHANDAAHDEVPQKK